MNETPEDRQAAAAVVSKVLIERYGVRGYSGGICGETYDHDECTVFEDDHIWQGECRNCGAELWFDKDTSD